MECKEESAPTRFIRHTFIKYADYDTYSCFEHAVNLGNIAILSHITKIAVIESTATIWEYYPTLPDNHVLSSSSDVITSVLTIAIKVCTLRLFNSF